MILSKSKFLFVIALIGLYNLSFAQCAKFEPKDGHAILLIGGDNKAIGGMPGIGYSNGYLDRVEGPIPGGFMQYTSIVNLEGLTAGAYLCTGHDNVSYLTNQYSNTVIQLGIYCVGVTADIVNGKYDINIDKLANYCKSLAPRPIFLRWGYEFDYQYGGETSTYSSAWKKAHDRFKASGVDNVAWVWASAYGDFSNWNQISSWYPGDDYVDWFGYSQWTFPRFGKFMIEESARRKKPCMISESCWNMHTLNADSDWDNWFQKAFDLFKTYPNLKAWSYINSNWDTVGNCWSGWGDSRIQNVPSIKTKWLTEINKPFWLKSSDTLYNSLGECYKHLSVNSIGLLADNVKLYPNPFNADFTYVINSNVDSKVSISIVNVVGEEVYHNDNLHSNSEIKLGDNWKSGFYLIKSISNNQLIITKLVKE